MTDALAAGPQPEARRALTALLAEPLLPLLVSAVPLGPLASSVVRQCLANLLNHFSRLVVN